MACACHRRLQGREIDDAQTLADAGISADAGEAPKIFVVRKILVAEGWKMRSDGANADEDSSSEEEGDF